ALGYSNLSVGLHYAQLMLLVVALGTGLGVVVGGALGDALLGVYHEYFRFPELTFAIEPRQVVIAAIMATAAGSIGTFFAVRRAVALPPAEAMRAEPPASFRPGVFERLGLGSMLPTAARMILRNVERTPVRSALSIIGVSFATAILVIGMFMFDGVDRMMDLQFGQTQREDLAISFNRPLAPRVTHELARLEGVTQVEGFRSVPVRLRNGHLFQDSGILGLPMDATLRRVTASSGRVQPLPPEGIVLSDLLAERLDVGPGDWLEAEVLEGRRPTRSVPVAGIVEDFIGLAVYMDLNALNRLVGDRSLSGALLAVDDGHRGALNSRLKRTPAVASVASPDQTLASFQKQLDEGLLISVFFILGFSGVIALAVIYNGARVALSERGRELASLRVLGFTRREVAVLLLGEQGITTLAAIPLGCLLGYGLAAAVAAGIRTDAYRIPFVVSTNTFLLAAGITILAALMSGLIVRRRLDRMDLIEVLKTRE
ncbi:MAG: FtsX-like permease family protein, partial [Rhodothermales bacterium]|nr:FtsX-like permease family protein [Rhodothermales bacterium]